MKKEYKIQEVLNGWIVFVKVEVPKYKTVWFKKVKIESDFEWKRVCTDGRPMLTVTIGYMSRSIGCPAMFKTEKEAVYFVENIEREKKVVYLDF